MRLREALKSSTVLAKPDCTLSTRTCAICQNQGYVIAKVKQTVGPFLKASICSCVEQCLSCFGTCMKATDKGSLACKTPSPRRIVSLLLSAQIPTRYAEAEVSNFHNFSGNGSVVINKVKSWLLKFRLEDPKGLILSGPVGVGKTFLLAGIAKDFCRRGLSVRFVDFHQLLAHLRSAYSEKVSEESLLSPLIDCDILMIDELGKGRGSDWEQEKLDQLVMGRYNQNKVIIATTNYKFDSSKNLGGVFERTREGQFNPDVFEGLESRVGKRIYSRLYETSILVDLSGHDFRRKDPCPVVT